MRVTLVDEPMCPVDVPGRLHGADRRYGASTFGDEQSRPRAHPLQMSAEMGLEVANTNSLHTGLQESTNYNSNTM